MFDDRQRTELAKPLDRANVKGREQSGRQLSYIEGWHAIAEANRIFGFDGWSRETVEIKCVSEHARQIGKTNPQPGHGVSYIARVRVNVGGIIREGCGTGHGIDRDLGQAHESALKEAETDAMKRALMTFGNPFGLALYDKTQENVIDRLPKKNARDIYARLQAECDVINIPSAMDQWLSDNEGRIQVLPEDWESILRLRIQERKLDIERAKARLDAATPPEHDSKWDTLGPVKQAGILCSEPAFWKFRSVANADDAAKDVRAYCNVTSRKELATNDNAGKLWRKLVADYRAWQRADVPNSVAPHRAPTLGASGDAADQRPPENLPGSAGGREVSLEDEARAIAKLGSAPFEAFWRGLEAYERGKLKPLGDELRKLMDEAAEAGA